MRNINVRDVVSDDAQKFIEYEMATAGNLFDPEAGLYPSSFTLCAENEQGPVIFLPVQQPFLLESLGIAPDADKRDVALSLRKLMNVLIQKARAEGRGEIYFGCKEESTIAFAEHHGFSEVPFKMYRLKVKDYKCA